LVFALAPAGAPAGAPVGTRAGTPAGTSAGALEALLAGALDFLGATEGLFGAADGRGATEARGLASEATATLAFPPLADFPFGSAFILASEAASELFAGTDFDSRFALAISQP
jgi:hypothetical protein